MLTETQSKLLKYIGDYTKRNHYAPSYEEMKRHMKLTSKGRIYEIIKCLKERGFVRQIPKKSRAIEVIRWI